MEEDTSSRTTGRRLYCLSETYGGEETKNNLEGLLEHKSLNVAVVDSEFWGLSKKPKFDAKEILARTYFFVLCDQHRVKSKVCAKMNRRLHAEIVNLVSPEAMVRPRARVQRRRPIRKERKPMRHQEILESLYSGVAPFLALRLTERERQEEGTMISAPIYRVVLSILLRAPEMKTVKTLENALKAWTEDYSEGGKFAVGVGALGISNEIGKVLEFVKDAVEGLMMKGVLHAGSAAMEYYNVGGFGADEEDEKMVSAPVQFVKHDVATSPEVVRSARRMGSAVFLEHVVRVMGRRGQGWKEVVEGMENGRQKLSAFLQDYLKEFPRRIDGKMDSRHMKAVHALYESIWGYIVSTESRRRWREASVTLMETIIQDGRIQVLEAFIDSMSDHELCLEFCYVFLTKRFARDDQAGSLPKKIFPRSSRQPRDRWTCSNMDLEIFSKLASFKGHSNHEWTSLSILLQGIASSWLHVNNGQIVFSQLASLTKAKRDHELKRLQRSIGESLENIKKKTGKEGQRSLGRLRMLMKVLYVRAEREEVINIETLEV